MKHFLQAIKEGGKHWPALVAAFACSLGVAALWGANIAALFPIIETTLSGKSPQQWSLERVELARQSLDDHQGQIAELRQQQVDPDQSSAEEIGLRIEALEARVEVDRASLSSAQWLNEFASEWLPSSPFQTVVAVVALVLVATAIRLLLVLSNAILVSWVSQSIVRDLRSKIFNKAIELDAGSFEAHGVSGIQARLTHTADLLSHGITSFYSGAVTEPLRIASCLCGALWISWRLTLASLIVAPLAGFLMVTLNRQVRGLVTKALDRSLGFHHITLDVLSAHKAVQANTMEDFECRRFKRATGDMRNIAIKARFYEALARPLTELFGMGMLCTGLMCSSYLVLNQETSIFGIRMTDVPLSVTSVTVFLGMLIGASDPLRKLSNVVAGINNGMAAANLIYPLLEQQPLIRSPESSPHPATSFRRLELRNVHFSYDGQTQVLKGVDLEVDAGERLAVLGVNGSGKSTLVNLICRYYDPHQGQLLINGGDARQHNLRDLRSLFSVVSQNTELFNETVFHNVRYGRWDASEEEIIEAAKLARAHEFISQMPQGYQTVIGANGQRLSGGQRQRLALARAFLRNADVLILDEATSQIDVDSERLIHEALAEYSGGRTVIFITHRESTLSLATRIVRMEAGKAVAVENCSQSAA